MTDCWQYSTNVKSHQKSARMDQNQNKACPASKRNYACCGNRVSQNWRSHNVQNLLLRPISLIKEIAPTADPDSHQLPCARGSVCAKAFWVQPLKHSMRYAECPAETRGLRSVSIFRP